MTLVKAENLAKNFGNVNAVDGLTLSLNEGSITGLIGPNGAGKTTTIKMILGLLKPDQGKVEVFGQDPWDNPAIRPLIGVIHEKAFFPAHQKTLEYLQRVCRIFGVPESRAMEVLKLVDLQGAWDRPIKGLSAGMLQKFSISHALIHSPKLIIGDEMTANLDPQARSSLFDLVSQLHDDEGVTFLVSSHILPELSRICDSVVIVNHGKVGASGTLNELYGKFAAGIIRVSTDKSAELAQEIRALPYAEVAEVDGRGVSVQVPNDKEEALFEDVSRLARKVNAKIYGIETGNASIEALYERVMSASEGGR
ncbi:MAG: ABC transporter ATP-binding protein [Candidatus Bathyarchaeota archaeon]|nr:ABC transporter ATP-binding protein [Candidatus Bathyarchaeota archaeon]